MIFTDCYPNATASQMAQVYRLRHFIIPDKIISSTKHPIDLFAKEAFFSPRQFERKAYDYLRISFKLFNRMSRFVQSYGMKLQHKNLDWLSIAILCGYQDYQHLVKDYFDFASTLPTQLFNSEESKALERMLGLIK